MSDTAEFFFVLLQIEHWFKVDGFPISSPSCCFAGLGIVYRTGKGSL